MKPTFILTFDVETTSIARNGLFDDVGQKVLTQGLPPLLDKLEKNSLKATFFYTGYIAKKFPDVVKIVDIKGHEIASHGMSHKPEHAFDVLSLIEQKNHLIESKNILEDITGKEIISFRAPALRVDKNTPVALLEAGFKIDSSIASQRFDFFLSFGSFKKLNRLSAPRNPYFVSKNNLAKRGNTPILEIPISALIIPYIGTTIRLMPGNISKLVRSYLRFESCTHPQKPIVFLFHPNEILTENTDVVYKRRAKYFVSYFLADYIRRNLKLKNLGQNAIVLFEKEIKYFKSQRFQFTTLCNFAKKLQLNKEDYNNLYF